MKSQTVIPKLPVEKYQPFSDIQASAFENDPAKFSAALSLKPFFLHFPAVLSWHTKYRPMSGGWVRRM